MLTCLVANLSQISDNLPDEIEKS